jgi:hypothetical protein
MGRSSRSSASEDSKRSPPGLVSPPDAHFPDAIVILSAYSRAQRPCRGSPPGDAAIARAHPDAEPECDRTRCIRPGPSRFSASGDDAHLAPGARPEDSRGPIDPLPEEIRAPPARTERPAGRPARPRAGLRRTTHRTMDLAITSQYGHEASATQSRFPGEPAAG